MEWYNFITREYVLSQPPSRLQSMSHDSLDHHAVVSLPELLYSIGSLLHIFIATFTSDILWFLSCCEIPAHLPVTIACHNHERCWSSRRVQIFSFISGCAFGYGFSGYVFPKEVLATALEGSSSKVQMILYVSKKTWQRLRNAIPYPSDRVNYPMHAKVA
ncbi:uncharacterized protein LOC130750094 [Actinidia eriantha]|uniref:uncharacterized protein LOC130750094 n=1 Tax=Actinidia eriantha TaxID=165200 RepID=UPI002585696B|nr:uncharacterized protein LOC130750094 [Actinidia eriantha]